MDTVLTSSAEEYPGMTEAWLENLRYGWGDSIGVIPPPRPSPWASSRPRSALPH